MNLSELWHEFWGLDVAAYWMALCWNAIQDAVYFQHYPEDMNWAWHIVKVLSYLFIFMAGVAFVLEQRMIAWPTLGIVAITVLIGWGLWELVYRGAKRINLPN